MRLADIDKLPKKLPYNFDNEDYRDGFFDGYNTCIQMLERLIIKEQDLENVGVENA